MTKHIVGLILFTFIVGTSAVVAGLFQVVNPRVISVAKLEVEKPYVYKRKRHCRKKRPRVVEIKNVGLVSATVSQAVFNPSTGQLTTKFKFQKAEIFGKKVLKLHFYVSDRFGTRHLKSDRIFVPVKGDYMVSSYDWLSNLSSKQNLYVMAEVSKQSKWTVTPVFNRSKATPILIRSKK